MTHEELVKKVKQLEARLAEIRTETNRDVVALHKRINDGLAAINADINWFSEWMSRAWAKLRGRA